MGTLMCSNRPRGGGNYIATSKGEILRLASAYQTVVVNGH